VCPADAIGHPRLDFAGPFAEAKALADAGCRDLLIVCTAVLLRAGPERIRLTGGPWGLLEIPALASLGPAEVVRLAGLGFDRVVGLSDGACCPGGPGAFAVVSNVLDRIGRRDRVVAWDLRAGPMPDAWSRPPDDDSRLPVTDSLPAFVRLLAPAWTDPIPLQGRGAGEVLLNAAACTLCEVCAERCPTEAITVEHSSGGTVRLTFDAGRCDACGLCVDACPERATSVRQMLDVQASRVVLHEDTWIRCSSCGAKVAPRGMVELVARRLGEPAGLDLCVDCKPRLALRSAARRARQDRAGARAP
jgi:ferredoxin